MHARQVVRLLLAVELCLLAVAGGSSGRGLGTPPANPTRRAPVPVVPTLAVDLDRACALTLPATPEPLKPVAFQTSDGREGWVVQIPGNRPIATPAVDKGRVFVGGGYGSTEFYAFDAATGALAWQVQCADDGPTAAVVEDDCCAFNTESCTVIVCDTQTGHIRWKEWLGDPLMSQPAIWQGRLYMAFPGGGRGHTGNSQAPAANLQAAGPAGARGYQMLCADLKTGEHRWQVPIDAEVITAPVVADGKLVFTCMNGTTLALDAVSGKQLWRQENAGTSAPTVVNGQVIATRRDGNGGALTEGIVRHDGKTGAIQDKQALAPGIAAYFQPGNSGNVGIASSQQSGLDASVGFGGGGPVNGSAAQAHLNLNGVAAGWAYQGARAAYGNGRIVNAQGRFFNSVDARTGQVRWRAAASGKQVDAATQMFAPPALGRANLYVVSAAGHLLSLRQSDARVNFAYAIGQPLSFQPALSGGSLLAGTNNGLLVCLKTGDPDADGWVAWGGNAQHNKTN